jgi:glycosyltransferase involved in cell wall biosynthesis
MAACAENQQACEEWDVTQSLVARPGSVDNQPLRVALFSGNYNYTLDGANKSLNRLVDFLQTEIGAQVRVYSPTTEHPAFEPAGDLISVPSVAIPSRPDYRIALGLPPAIRRNIIGFRPHLVHLSSPDLLGLGALRLARTLRIPAVASLHTLFDNYLDYYALGWMRPLLRRHLMRFYAGCDYVLAPTPALVDELRIEALPARIRLWARGVDPELFNPNRRCEAWRRAQGFAADRPVIVFMGRVVLEKGLGVFAETIRRLELRQGPVQVLVVGDGPARSWFAERLPGAVFTGLLTGHDLARALASGDILFNPSATETFGNVNLEAMSAGLALVCADAPNTRSILSSTSARLCEAADPDAFCRALNELHDDPGLLSVLQHEALARSAAYRWPEILQSIAEVYREACELRHGRGVEAAAGPSARLSAEPTLDALAGGW